MHPLAFFAQPAPTLAAALLGQEIAHTLPSGQTLSALIAETEAYMFEGDPAAHSARGATPATRALRMGPGTLYIHPMRQYLGLDIVGANGSVLLRAIQPHAGFPQNTALISGPGKLTRALGVTKRLYGLNVTASACPLHILPQPGINPKNILVTPRIGITKNAEAPLRFVLKP